MKNSLLVSLAFVTLFACFGCSNSCDVNFNLNQSFVLAQGGTACYSSDNTFTIHFDAVCSDSRCPINVQCVWAGRADVLVTLKHGATVQSVTLSSGDLGQGGTDQVVFSGFTVKLTDIAPPNQQGQTIPQSAYQATLIVTQ